jgi:hypothetical protein
MIGIMSHSGDSSLAQSARSGLTILELIIVIIIVLILAGLFLPAIRIHGGSNRSPCGNNLKQIVAACIAYSQDQNCSWPVGVSKSCVFPIDSAHQARLVTNRSFEVLANSMNLSNGLFKCKGTKLDRPQLKPFKDLRNGDEWGSSQKNPASYAYDWSCLAAPADTRIILADRSPANHGGKGVMAVGCDGATRFIKIGAHFASAHQTENYDGTSVTFVLSNPDASGNDSGSNKTILDNIYDDVGDEAKDPFAPLGGSARRAWVK